MRDEQAVVYRLIILAVLLLLVLRAVRLLIGSLTGTTARRTPPLPRQSPPMKLVRDPVCGTHVTPKSALSLTSRGATHYFCSEECRTKFRTGA